MRRLVFEFAKKQTNTIFLTSSVADILCNELGRIKPERDQAVRKAESDGNRAQRLEKEVLMLRADLKKQTNLVRDLTKNYDKMRAVLEPNCG